MLQLIPCWILVCCNEITPSPPSVDMWTHLWIGQYEQTCTGQQRSDPWLVTHLYVFIILYLFSAEIGFENLTYISGLLVNQHFCDLAACATWHSVTFAQFTQQTQFPYSAYLEDGSCKNAYTVGDRWQCGKISDIHAGCKNMHELQNLPNISVFLFCCFYYTQIWGAGCDLAVKESSWSNWGRVKRAHAKSAPSLGSWLLFIALTGWAHTA